MNDGRVRWHGTTGVREVLTFPKGEIRTANEAQVLRPTLNDHRTPLADMQEPRPSRVDIPPGVAPATKNGWLAVQ